MLLMRQQALAENLGWRHERCGGGICKQTARTPLLPRLGELAAGRCHLAVSLLGWAAAASSSKVACRVVKRMHTQHTYKEEGGRWKDPDRTVFDEVEQEPVDRDDVIHEVDTSYGGVARTDAKSPSFYEGGSRRIGRTRLMQADMAYLRPMRGLKPVQRSRDRRTAVLPVEFLEGAASPLLAKAESGGCEVSYALDTSCRWVSVHLKGPEQQVHATMQSLMAALIPPPLGST
eukprot:2563621-Amphidinium_carterae.1